MLIHRLNLLELPCVVALSSLTTQEAVEPYLQQIAEHEVQKFVYESWRCVGISFYETADLHHFPTDSPQVVG